MASWLSIGRLVGIWEAVVIWLLNAVMELEVVADVLKRGLTVPVYKGAENDLNLDSYRRVTVTSMVAKVLEFLVLEWLQPVFMEASLAHVNQSRQCHVGTPSLLPKRLWPGISESQRWESCLHVTCRRLWTQGEYNHWT